MNDRDIPTYIGRAPCGCIRFATVDVPEHAKSNATEIAKLVRAGWSIERVTVGWVRDNGFDHCKKCERPKRRKQAEQEALPL